MRRPGSQSQWERTRDKRRVQSTADAGDRADGPYLGALPRTRVWRDERGLNLASGDKAFIESVYLLSQLPLAARSEDFAGSLRNVGLDVPDAPGLMDVVG